MWAQRLDESGPWLGHQRCWHRSGYARNVSGAVGLHLGSNGPAIPLHDRLGNKPAANHGQRELRAPCRNGGGRKGSDGSSGGYLERVPIVIATYPATAIAVQDRFMKTPSSSRVTARTGLAWWSQEPPPGHSAESRDLPPCCRGVMQNSRCALTRRAYHKCAQAFRRGAASARKRNLVQPYIITIAGGTRSMRRMPSQPSLQSPPKAASEASTSSCTCWRHSGSFSAALPAAW